jgi:hypothetical protein
MSKIIALLNGVGCNNYFQSKELIYIARATKISVYRDTAL